MNFYMYINDIDKVKNLIEHNYSGALLTYNVNNGDYFVKIAKTIVPEKDFKYLVAIRPYAISPQYLCMINNSINEISKNKLQINFVSGRRKEVEKGFDGIIGPVNDDSSKEERSDYLVKYIDVLESLNVDIPDYYISATNQSVFDVGDKHNSKIIIVYSQYVEKKYDISNKKIMLALSLVLRETEEEINALDKNKYVQIQDVGFFTYKEFVLFLDELKEKEINEILIYSSNEEEIKRINNFVKQYKETENK